jgi:FkbM family methyltransferase
MRRIDPIYVAIVIVILLVSAIEYFRPEKGYRQALGTWLYQPVCEVPPGRQFGVEYYGLIYTGNTSNLVDQRVLCLGAWEKHILHFLGQTAQALQQAKSPDADDLVFVDVGANTGLHSLYMSQQVGQVHAFDPYPPVVAKMRHNVDHNRLENVMIHGVGLGDHAVRLPFIEPPGSNQGTGSFVREVKHDEEETALELEIAVGDGYFAEHGIDRVDIMKVDVEGFEKPVLLGLQKTLERCRPVIVAEIRIQPGVDNLFTSRQDIEAALPENYRLFSFAQWDSMTGSYQLGDLEVDFESAGYQWDTVAVPAEFLDLLPRTAEPSW